MDKAQVAEAVSVTATRLHGFAPVAVTVLVAEQASSGAVTAAVKVAEAPGAMLATVKTVLGLA